MRYCQQTDSHANKPSYKFFFSIFEDFLAGAKGNHVVADPKHHEGKSPPASSKPPPQTGDPNRDVGQAVRARASPLAPFRQARPRVPLPRPQAQLRLRQRQREEIQMEPFLRGYLPNPKFYGSQLSLMRQVRRINERRSSCQTRISIEKNKKNYCFCIDFGRF